MQCPFCKEDDDRVIDSRSSDGGESIRRRRECLVCKKRFTTYERVETAVKLNVIKKDGTRVPYDRQRIVDGVAKACYKRPVPMKSILQLAQDVEEKILQYYGQEVPSRLIGDLTMQCLQKLDKVAYVRYASVYREFQDVGQFINEIHEVMHQTEDAPGQKQLFEKE